MVENADSRVARWRYVVPNAITSFSLLVGVMATFKATQGQFLDAGWLIVLCVLLDKLDGTAARALGASSEFGMQLDSFADLVAFGIAPGMLAFCYVSTDPQGFFAWWHSPGGNIALHAMVGVFILGACLRLAKFNVTTEIGGPKIFYGMPSTYAGGFVGITFLVASQYSDIGFFVGVLRILPVIALLCGLAMVSNAVLPKVVVRENKVLNVFQLIAIAGAYICGFARAYPEFLFVLMGGYGLVGFAWGFMHRGDFREGDEHDPIDAEA